MQIKHKQEGYEVFLDGWRGPLGTFSTQDEALAALSLSQIISDISEERYCAGWIKDIEHHVWDMLADGTISPRTYICSLLSEKCNGWIWYNDDGEKWISLEEWKNVHHEWLKKKEME